MGHLCYFIYSHSERYKVLMEKVLISCFILLLAVSTTALSDPQQSQITYCDGKIVLGRIAKITLVDKDLTLDAKLDTGATMAALTATNIKIFNRDGKLWVQFTVNLPSVNKKVAFTEAVVRYTHILKRNEENTSDKYAIRPVISLIVGIGSQRKPILISLTDRSFFRYPMLLGSDALKKFNIVVDVSRASN